VPHKNASELFVAHCYVTLRYVTLHYVTRFEEVDKCGPAHGGCQIALCPRGDIKISRKQRIVGGVGVG
jgi:hypothetical protein